MDTSLKKMKWPTEDHVRMQAITLHYAGYAENCKTIFKKLMFIQTGQLKLLVRLKGMNTTHWKQIMTFPRRCKTHYKRYYQKTSE